MEYTKEEAIWDGEAVLRKTIAKLNKKIRTYVADFNRKVSSSSRWDYNRVYITIANNFFGSDQRTRAHGYYNTAKPLYTRMCYQSLLMYNNYLGEIVKNLENNYSIGNAINHAKQRLDFPITLYEDHQGDRSISSQRMEDGIRAIRDEVAKEYFVYDMNIYCLDEVMAERKEKEAVMAERKAQRKTKTKSPKPKEAFKDVELSRKPLEFEYWFDENGTPVYGTKDGWQYVDGRAYNGNVYDEHRTTCILPNDTICFDFDEEME